jgi:hypothetical protein
MLIVDRQIPRERLAVEVQKLREEGDGIKILAIVPTRFEPSTGYVLFYSIVYETF